MRMHICVALALVMMWSLTACWAESDSVDQFVSLGVNEVAEIGIYGTVGDMAIDDPAIGGNTPATRSSDSTYLNYTSIVPAAVPGPGLMSRKIQAQITAGTVPAGTNLTLHAEVEGGTGTVGSRIGTDEKTLGIKPSPTDPYPAVDIIDGIKCGWTGVGSGKGGRLFYTFGVYDWSLIHITEMSQITVTFTLMDPH